MNVSAQGLQLCRGRADVRDGSCLNGFWTSRLRWTEVKQRHPLAYAEGLLSHCGGERVRAWRQEEALAALRAWLGLGPGLRSA